jgi:hypothetical protein
MVKITDVSGFVASFRQYDILTNKMPAYGYLFPFIEIFLGIAYLADTMMMYWFWINGIAFIITFVTTLSIVRALSKPHKIHCACLGAHTDLHLSGITLIESGSMVIMTAGMLMWMI